MKRGRPTAEHAGKALPFGPLFNFVVDDVRLMYVDQRRTYNPTEHDHSTWADVSTQTWRDWQRTGEVPRPSAHQVADHLNVYLSDIWGEEE